MNPRSFERPGGDVDQLLRDYFRAEMPAPWPAVMAPAQSPNASGAPVRRLPGYHSRFALAASLLLLLSGYWLLSGMFSTYTQTFSDQKPAPAIGTNPRSPKMRKAVPSVRPHDQKESRRFLSGSTLT